MRVLKNLFEQNRKWAEKVKESEVHGWIYSIENGILQDLDVCVTGIDETPGQK